jgi:two-component system sensor histidine kinase DesK
MALKDKEIVELARIAERERIARDLHDVLGHTLSLVALKADLALRLIDTDRTRSAAEMTEVSGIARKALSDVRQTIGGIQHVTWIEGVQTAKALLDAANVSVTISAFDAGALDARAQTILAHVLIEASTNISRHSSATAASFILDQDGVAVTLTVEDNGAEVLMKEGSGLHGLRVRLEAAGGSLEWSRLRSGLRLTARLPTCQIGSAP